MIWFFVFTTVGVATMTLLLVCQSVCALNLTRGLGRLLLLGALWAVTTWSRRVPRAAIP